MKTKTLISFVVTAKLVCVFVFANAKCWFSHDKAHMYDKSCDIHAFLVEFQMIIFMYAKNGTSIPVVIYYCKYV